MAEAAKRDAANENEGSESVPKKKADLVGIVLLALVAINLAAVGGLGFYMKRLTLTVHELEEKTTKPATPEGAAEHSPMGKELQPQNLGILYPLEPFLVNINTQQGSKFLQAQIELELADPALEDEISRKKAALRDAVIVLLTSRNYTQLREANGLKNLRSDLVKSLNSLLSTGKVKEVYFTQFHFN